MFAGEWPTIPEMFRITVERFGHRKGFTSFEPEYLSLTYGEILTRVERTAGYLGSLGIGNGDMVALTGKNSPEWAIAYLSVLFAGGVIVPLDYQLHEAEIENLLKIVGAKALFVDKEKYDVFDQKKLGLLEKISLSKEKANYILDINYQEKPVRDGREENDLAAVLFTSGTTGNAKGVMLSHKNLVSDCYLSQANLNISCNDVFYALLPIHHSYTMLAVFIESLSVGAEIVFGKNLAIKQILSDLKKGRVTMFLGIPMLFNKLIKGLMRGIREKGPVVYGIIRFLMAISGAIKKTIKVNPGKIMFKAILAKVSLEHIRICISGGGPLPASTFKQFNQLGIDFVQGYGLTETSPIVTLNPTDHYKEASVGKVIPRVDVKILNANEQSVGVVGIKGPIVMQGYYKNEAETRRVFDEDGYLITGDVGYLDKENYLYLTGRLNSMIVTEGGKNVYPEEIENHFQLYDEIEQILVKGFVQDEKMKREAIEAYIYPVEETRKLGRDVVEKRFNTIIAEVNRELHSYQRISRFKILDEPMETTTTRKIKRFKIEKSFKS